MSENTTVKEYKFDSISCDKIIKTSDDCFLRVHSHVLINSCEYFKSLDNFREMTKQKKSTIIKLEYRSKVALAIFKKIYNSFNGGSMTLRDIIGLMQFKVDEYRDMLLLLDILQVNINVDDFKYFETCIIWEMVRMSNDWLDITEDMYNCEVLKDKVIRFYETQYMNLNKMKDIDHDDIDSIENEEFKKLMIKYSMTRSKSIESKYVILDGEIKVLNEYINICDEIIPLLSKLYDEKPYNYASSKQEKELDLLSKKMEILKGLCVKKKYLAKN